MKGQKITTEQLEDSNIAASLKKLNEFDVLLYTSIRNQICNGGGMDAEVFQTICNKPFHMPINALHKLINLFGSAAPVEVYKVMCDVFEEKPEDEYEPLMELILKGMAEGFPLDKVRQLILTSDTVKGASDNLDIALQLTRTSDNLNVLSKITRALDNSAGKQETSLSDMKDKDASANKMPASEIEKKEQQDNLTPVTSTSGAGEQTRDIKNMAGYGMHPVQVFYPTEPDNPPFLIETNDDLFKAIEHLIERLKKVYIAQQRHLTRVENTSVSQLQRISELENLLTEEK